MQKRSAAPAVFMVLMLLSLLAVLGALIFWFVNAIGLIVGGSALPAAEERQIVTTQGGEIVEALNKGRTLQADGLFDQTTRMLAIRLNDDESTGYINLAAEITKRGRPTDAVRYLMDAAKNDDVNWNPLFWWTLAEAQRKANDPEQAAHSEAEADRRADVIRQTLGQKPPTEQQKLHQQVTRLIQAGMYYNDQKDDSVRALPLLEEALRLAPEDPRALNALGCTLADKGATTADFDRAVDLTKKALASFPDDAMFLDSYGWALFKKNDLAGARRVLREAVDDDPAIPELHYHLGVVYAQLGLTTDARLELERALVLDPDSKEVQDAIQRLRLPAGQGVLESV